jgi:hypothetical protein
LTEIIGRGERTCLSILKSLYPEAEFITQCLLSKIVDKEWGLSERQEKETLDIVYKLKGKTYVVRVQDPHHDGLGMQRVDAVQKKTLEFYDCKVIDIWYNDCPKLFADTYNDLSISELKEVYKDNGISV